jgi:NAD(P)-dependent dehydrogenase (short-subunit alcohol dehydrogenase family)
MNAPNGLSGKTAVVTGGGGGLGRAIVARLLTAGAEVLAVDIDAASLEKLSADSPGVRTLTLDIRTSDAPERILAAVGGTVDILFNNAGILDGLQLIDEVDEERFDDVLAVNLRAPFRLCRAVLPGMVERGGGVIVNTASLAGLKGGRAGASYTTSKWGLIGLTKSIAMSHGSLGVRCNAVCPGAMDTLMNHTTFSDAGLAMVMRDSGAKPPVDPDVVAAVAVFLASEDAAHMNGVALPVDGGAGAF